MRSAADLKDEIEKHPVTPGPILPARELLGELLMELNQAKLALPEFETVLRSSPKRFNATYGAARATELSKDRNRANERYWSCFSSAPEPMLHGSNCKMPEHAYKNPEHSYKNSDAPLPAETVLCEFIGNLTRLHLASHADRDGQEAGA